MTGPSFHSDLGPLMRAARKFKNLNQADVAQAIGCSQSALSKMEHSRLLPDAHQWFLFARFTAIPPETIELGVIDRHTRVLLNDAQDLRLPKRFRLNRAQKVKEIYPLIHYFDSINELKLVNDFFKSSNLETEFFLDFDNLVSFQLMIDLINLFIKEGISTESQIREIVLVGQDSIYWDHYFVNWMKFQSVKELLIEYIFQQPFFQGDFDLSLTEREGHIIFTYLPKEHIVLNMKDVSEQTKQWLILYRKYTIENLVKFQLGIKVEAIYISAHQPLSLGCHFKIMSKESLGIL
jgi:transcriptional regulator with XRE-family HTH domain